MKRTRPLSRRTRLVSASPMKKVNRKRRQSEFARCYGSKVRVAFVKALPCVVCFATPCDNAHIETDGMGRKADYMRVVPLCRKHHEYLHKYGRNVFEGLYLIRLPLHAEYTEAMWARHLATRTA